ncbi:hypothetical protein AMTRI_Chr08g202850 [Amborella trichopoda]
MSQGFEQGCLGPKVSDHSFLRMNMLRSQPHVAQQSRREKLRVQLNSSSSSPPPSLSQTDTINQGMSHYMLNQSRDVNIGAIVPSDLPESCNFSRNFTGIPALPLCDPNILQADMSSFASTSDALSPRPNPSGFLPLKPNNPLNSQAQQNCDILMNYAPTSASASSYGGNNPLFGPSVLGGILSGSLKEGNFSSSSQLFLLNNPYTTDPNAQSSVHLLNPCSSDLSLNQESQKQFLEIPNMHFPGFHHSSLPVTSSMDCNSSLYGSQINQNLRDPPPQAFLLPTSYANSLQNIEFKANQQLSVGHDTSGQGLSLSLSSHQPSELHIQDFQSRFGCHNYGPSKAGFFGSHQEDNKGKGEEFYSKQCNNGNIRDYTSFQRFGSGSKGFSGSVHGMGGGPLGPFTGYASILKSSTFLKPAQQLLDEFCNVGQVIQMDGSKARVRGVQGPFERGNGGGGGSSCGVSERGGNPSVSASSIHHSTETSSEAGVDNPVSSSDRAENHKKKTKLVSMLNEVFQRYKLYYNQMQMVMTSFECVAGLSAAAPYTALALRAMSKHFKCLKNAIADQLLSTSRALGEDCTPLSVNKGESTSLRILDQSLRHQRTVQSSAIIEQPQHVWRPQRGLPERAVAVLRAWLFEHFLHPYPTDTDKQMLAKQTGLTRNQVSNWFINARVRLWKPMVEEMHMLENKESSSNMDLNSVKNSEEQASKQAVNSEHQSASSTAPNNEEEDAQQGHEPKPMKRLRNEELSHHPLNPNPISTEYPSSYQSSEELFPRHSGVGGVSLTLGLRHNGVQDNPFYHQSGQAIEFAAHHHFSGLHESNESEGLQVQNLQLRRHLGTQLLHDFVG